MLYVLECMIYAFVCMGAGSDKPLHTTGNPCTLNDVGVAILGWECVVLIIFFLRYVIRYLRYKRNISGSAEGGSSSSANKKIYKNFLWGLLYMFECLPTGVLYLCGKRQRPMRTTGEPPTNTELNYFIVWLISLAIIIAAVVLIVV